MELVERARRLDLSFQAIKPFFQGRPLGLATPVSYVAAGPDRLESVGHGLSEFRDLVLAPVVGARRSLRERPDIVRLVPAEGIFESQCG